MDSSKKSTGSTEIPKESNRKSLLVKAGAGLVFAIVAFAGVLFYHSLQQSRQFVPKDIKQQVTYTVFKPTDTSNIVADKSSIKFDSSVKLLSYRAVQKDTGANLTFSMQPTPETFVDIPQAYDKFTESLHQYSAFDSLQGKVYLTKPAELQGGQSAVMSSKGTLMFIKPDKNLTDDAWKLLFSNLDIVK